MDKNTQLLWDALVRIAKRCKSPDSSSSPINSLVELRNDVYSEADAALIAYQEGET